MTELVFEITQEADGGYCAECLSEAIFSHGDNWEQLRENVKEAVKAYYFDQPQIPARIRLHLVKDEVVMEYRIAIGSDFVHSGSR